ncbi:MAG: MarR family transcriptional regulator [Candidatus Promineifilaceae bacterium]
MEDSKFIANQLMSIMMPLTRTIAAELRHGEKSLNMAHLGALAMLTERPCNLSELADLQGVSLPTMSGSISRLETRGWVRRERSTADRRVVMVELTSKGQQRLVEMVQRAESYLIGELEKLDSAERETLAAGLSVLQTLFE